MKQTCNNSKKVTIIYYDKYNLMSLLKWVKVKSLSRVRLFATPWTVAYQAPPSIEFSRQEYWSGLPFPSPGDLPDPGNKPGCPQCRQMVYPLESPGNPVTKQYKRVITSRITYLLLYLFLNGFRFKSRC